MFYNGVNKSTIHSQINPGYHYVPSGNADDCYFTLNGMEDGSTNPWRILDQGSGNTNRTHQYPFYTYLSDWSSRGNKDRPSYMILMVPWKLIAETTTGPEGEEAISGGDFQYTYYQIETTPVDEYAYYENTFYQLLLKVGVIGSFELPEPVVVNAQYMVVPWGTVDVPGTLREGKYLILETREYTMNNINSASIPYITSHEIEEAYVTQVKYFNVSSDKNQFYQEITRTNSGKSAPTFTATTYVGNENFTVNVDNDNNRLTLSHTISTRQYTPYEVTVYIKNKAGLDDTVVFTIYPAIYVGRLTGGNAFIEGRFARVQNPPSSGGQGWYELNERGYYRSSNTGANNNNSAINAVYGSLLINLGTGGVEIEDMVRITVTSFSEADSKYTIRKNNVNTEYTYKLADPRVDSNIANSLEPYWITTSSNRQTQTTGSWSGKQIKTGSSSSDLIAPDFIISSGRGRTQGMNAQFFDTFEKRCATYQEAGYPAGRWRIPTEAELAYIYKLQSLNIIPVLFQPENSAYWASSGYAVNSYTNGVANFTNNPNVGGAGRAGVRCVYDIWYWGDDPVTPTNEYHAMPTKNNN